MDNINLNIKVLKAVLHGKLFIPNVKSFGDTILAGEHVTKVNAKVELAIAGQFLKVSVGKNIELVPLTNVLNLTVVPVE